MREPPTNLANETLAACLQSAYGLAVTTVTLLPLGQDTTAWVCRVGTADNASYFLKIRTSIMNAPSLLVPCYLHDHGVTQVIPPLPTSTGALWIEVAGYVLSLYPFIAGPTGMEHGMMPAQWIAYEAILRQIHTTAITPALAHLMRRETFVPAGVDTVREVEAHIAGQNFADAAAQDLATMWHERRHTIHALVARAEELGRHLALRAPPCVLCHADIHTNNVLLDAGGELWIVDWDDTILAPKECDLMFVVGGGLNRALVGPHEEDLVLQGYGATTLDPLALTYYRCVRAVSDLGEYGAQVFLRPDLDLAIRQAAVGRFLIGFQPGRIVALALASDE